MIGLLVTTDAITYCRNNTNSPWFDGSTITHTSYYEFTEEGDGGTGDDPGEPTSESWTKVSSWQFSTRPLNNLSLHLRHLQR